MKQKIRKKIKSLIDKKDYQKIDKFVKHYGPKKVLTAIGRINNGFSPEFFIDFLNHKNSNVRLLAAKNVGKVITSEVLPKIQEYIDYETNSDVRRELYSAVGRLKEEENIPILLKGLEGENPKIMMQCIRGLLYHKNKPEVHKKLKKLRDHPNEIIQEIINRELGYETNKRISKEEHVHVDEDLQNKLVLGDVRNILNKVPERSIHLTFTSPPYYNAKDYSFYNSYEEYLQFITDIAKQIHRVTKEGRYFVLNTSPVLVPRFSRKYSSRRYLIPYDLHPRIVDLGFDFIEEIVWKKPEASAINRNGGFYQHRKPLAYKANHCTESVIVYRKKTSRLIDWNIKKYDKETVNESKVTTNYESSNVWRIAPSSSKIHPAIFPEKLAKRVIKFYSMKGDLVMDPMAGIGTVGKAALKLDRKFFLIDKEKKYLRKAYRDCNNLFTDVEFIRNADFNV